MPSSGSRRYGPSPARSNGRTDPGHVGILIDVNYLVVVSRCNTTKLRPAVDTAALALDGHGLVSILREACCA
jgi:hypothetical protein